MPHSRVGPHVLVEEPPPLSPGRQSARRTRVSARRLPAVLTAVRRAHENVSFWERHARESVALTCLLDNQDGIPALAPLRPAIMHELASCMSRQSCAEGEVVVSQGDRAEPQYFYIVQSGAFQASSIDVGSAERKVLATYGAGGYFGELALLRNTPRAATVACTAAGEVWRLGRAAFRRGVIGRSLREAAEKIAFLRPLAPEVLDQIVDAMFEVPCTVGEVVIRQGDPGGNLYLVEDGAFEASLRELDDKVVMRYEHGACFGERALLHNAPRAATVTCVADGRLWAIDRLNFRKVIMGDGFSSSGATHVLSGEAEEAAEEAVEEEESEENAADEQAARAAPIDFESTEDKESRKRLRRSPRLRKQLEHFWRAADTHRSRMDLTSYQNYHLSMNRALFELTADEPEGARRWP